LIVHRATIGRSAVGRDVGVGGDAERCAGLVVESAAVGEIQALGVVGEVDREGRRAVVVQGPAGENLVVVAHRRPAQRYTAFGVERTAPRDGTAGPYDRTVDRQGRGPAQLAVGLRQAAADRGGRGQSEGVIIAIADADTRVGVGGKAVGRVGRVAVQGHGAGGRQVDDSVVSRSRHVVGHRRRVQPVGGDIPAPTGAAADPVYRRQ